MKVLFYLLFFLSITCPASHAESTFNMNDAFVIAKARKLGHSDPFSFGENTSATGSSSYRFECHDPYCKTCNYSTGVCSICNTYYFLSGRLCKSCSSISVSNGICTNCSATGSCTQATCNKGYFNKSGACLACSSIKVTNGSCTQCTQTGSCTQASCNKGYINKDGTCKTCSQVFSNCAECNSTKCTKCKSDMLLKDGKCVACPKNAKCNGTENFTCNSSFIKKGNLCLHCPAGCSSCEFVSKNTTEVKCTSCESQFRLDDRIGKDSMCRPRCCDDNAGLVWPSNGIPGYYSDHIGLRSVCRNGSGCKGWTRCNNADLNAYDY